MKSGAAAVVFLFFIVDDSLGYDMYLFVEFGSLSYFSVIFFTLSISQLRLNKKM